MRRILFATTAIGFGLGGALAQTPTPQQTDMMYEAARNQLGILEYCQENGHIDSAVVDVQTKLLGLLPAPSDTSKGDAAEEQGKQGKVVAMGNSVAMSDSAKAQGIDEAGLCKTMASAIQQAAGALPK